MSNQEPYEQTFMAGESNKRGSKRVDTPRDVLADEPLPADDEEQASANVLDGCAPAKGEEGKYEHGWKCSCYPRIDSYDGPSWELERVLSGRQSGPCRTRHLPDYSKPLSRCSNYEIGKLGEDLAEKYLVLKGWEVVARNYRSPAGEADIVAYDDQGALVLVEVKSRYVRGKAAMVMPEIAVDLEKQRRYRNIGLLYIATHPSCDNVRFDVVAVNMADGHRAQIRHLEGAFEWDEQGAQGL